MASQLLYQNLVSSGEAEGHLAQLSTHPEVHELGASEEPRLAWWDVAMQSPLLGPLPFTCAYVLWVFPQVVLGPHGDRSKEHLLGRPDPSMVHMRSNSCSQVYRCCSLGKHWA